MKKTKDEELDNEAKIKKIAEKKGLKGDSLLHFMAQAKKETNNFKTFKEDAHYSVKAMRENFKKARKMSDKELKEISPKYRGTRDRFFDTFYSNRKDLGTGEKEGSLYYGRGPLQLTGKHNYKKYDIDPKKMDDLEYSTEKSVEYFKDVTKNIKKEEGSDAYTKRINRHTPSKSYKDRENFYKEYKNTDDTSKFYFGSGKPSKEINDSGREPQSVDQVNRIDSSIQKDNGMARQLKSDKDMTDEERMRARMARSEQENPNQRSFGEIMDTPTRTGEQYSSVDDFQGADPLQKATIKAHSAENVQNGPTSERKKLQTESRNMDNVTGGGANSQQKRNNGEQPEVKDQFMEAIGFFLPSMIGGVIGSAIGGNAGAAEGIKLGMEGASAFRNAKLARDKFEFSKQTQQNGVSRFQQSDFVDENGRPLSFDPSTNKYYDPSGKVATVFKDPITIRQEQNLDRRDRALELRKVQIEHGISKDAQLSDTQVKEFKDITQVVDSIDRIDKLQKDVATGLGRAQFQNLAEFANAAPAKYTEMKSETSSALASYVKSISGAQVSEAEAQRLGAIIPNVNDAPKVFEAKLKTFRKIVAANKKAFKQAILKGQPLKAGTIKGLDEAEKEFAKEEEEKNKGFSRADIDAMKAKIRAERSK